MRTIKYSKGFIIILNKLKREKIKSIESKKEKKKDIYL